MWTRADVLRAWEEALAAPDGQEEAAGVACVWREDADGVWWTACGEGFVFLPHGTPMEHKFRFCPYCGRILKQEVYDGDEEEIGEMA